MWEQWMDAVLLERYADSSNAELCRELGVSERSLVRHARRLGVWKSAEHVAQTQRKAVRGSGLWFEYMRLTGRKVGNHGNVGCRFEKGHRFDAETEAKRVKALQDRAWDERVRLIHGFARRTKWKMRGYGHAICSDDAND